MKTVFVTRITCLHSRRKGRRERNVLFFVARNYNKTKITHANQLMHSDQIAKYIIMVSKNLRNCNHCISLESRTEKPEIIRFVQFRGIIICSVFQTHFSSQSYHSRGMQCASQTISGTARYLGFPLRQVSIYS